MTEERDAVIAERDALRRKLDAAITMLDELTVDSNGSVAWWAVANVIEHLRALAVLESDST